jgi:hypothetical protein
MRLFRRYFLTDVPFLLRAYVRELAGIHRAARLAGAPGSAAVAPSFGGPTTEPAATVAAE